MVRLIAAILALAAMGAAADLSQSLLAAASEGKTAEIKTLLDQGAPVEARDKKDRTPLMLAAQHGHAAAVRLLLARGAQADARDRDGFTAFGLTVFSPSGRGSHEEALRSLPAPARIRLAVDAEWNPARVQSSCFMSKGELPAEIGRLHLDTAMREQLLAFAGASGKNLVEIAAAPGDALLSLTLLPSVTCSGAADNVALEIRVRLFRTSDRQIVFEKSFGGGIRGLKTQSVNNAAQYGPVLLAWIEPQIGNIYWAAVEALYRSRF